MSGPVSEADTDAVAAAPSEPRPQSVQLLVSRTTEVAGGTVRRALPRRERRTIGAWCFLDHFGPEDVTPETAMSVGPHPHIGLQTVTWLLEGEVLHTDSIGSEQSIRPGQLNLMTAGHGVAHAEDGREHAHGVLHGVQLWVAQPEATRHGPPAFEHHRELPRVEVGEGSATVLVGELGEVRSNARTDSPLVGADLVIDSEIEVEATPTFEYGVVVLSGEIEVEGVTVSADELGYLGTGRDELRLTAVGGARALLLGGEPFEETLLMWWNFVARTRGEVGDAYRDWNDREERFGDVRSTLEPMPIPRPPWMS